MLKKRINIVQKLGGVVTIIVAFAALWTISVFEPPTFVQIICAFAGAFVCLVGIVILFAEGPILEEYWSKKAPEAK